MVGCCLHHTVHSWAKKRKLRGGRYSVSHTVSGVSSDPADLHAYSEGKNRAIRGDKAKLPHEKRRLGLSPFRPTGRYLCTVRSRLRYYLPGLVCLSIYYLNHVVGRLDERGRPTDGRQAGQAGHIRAALSAVSGWAFQRAGIQPIWCAQGVLMAFGMGRLIGRRRSGVGYIS